MSGYLTCWLVFHSDPLPQLPVPVRMDWLHCNQCYRREGIAFVVASCGHIVCESCVNPSKFLGLSSTEQCTVCGTSCNYLHISDKMKPQEQAYFSDPVKLMHSRLEHISQVALFQNRQKEKITAYFKQKSVDLEKRLKEVKEQSYRYSAFASVLLWEVSELRRENAELKKPLSQRRVSVGNFQTSSSNRMSRPVAITPPVTPGLRLPSTMDSHQLHWNSSQNRSCNSKLLPVRSWLSPPIPYPKKQPALWHSMDTELEDQEREQWQDL
ncbi:RING finger protein 212B-like isoform X13 [Brienomyrus brachyistius]|uniref:RING finger protein 212B-like isoform X13 n=1 Tax=Brienomyrus brachyistius TaxID=42636 RepID=UPI0020B320BA|nr:RING finger protein 212B-like isoform X13 [Brienomyrus brachyistius]